MIAGEVKFQFNQGVISSYDAFVVVWHVVDPVSVNISTTIDLHRTYLLSKICNMQYLLELLYLDEVISFAEMESITSQETSQSQVEESITQEKQNKKSIEKLLNVIKDMSGINFGHFLNALDRTGQIHLSSILIGTT